MTYRKYFTLSYDDGPRHDRRFVKMLNERGLKCTFNLNSGSMPEESKEEWRVSRSEAAELYRGHEIATHALTHPHLEELTMEEADYQIAQDIKHLSAIARTTRSTASFAVPERPLVLDPTCHHRDPRIFELIERFLAEEPKDGDMLFYLWGHSYEFDNNEEFNSWEHIERVLDAVAGKPDIQYVTNMQFFDR